MSQKITTRRKDYKRKTHKRKIRKTHKRKIRKTRKRKIRKTYKNKVRKTHKRKTRGTYKRVRKTYKRKTRKTYKRKTRKSYKYSGGAPSGDPDNPDLFIELGGERVSYTFMRLMIFYERLREQWFREQDGSYVDGVPAVFVRNEPNTDLVNELLTTFPTEDELDQLSYLGVALTHDERRALVGLIHPTPDMDENKRIWQANEPTETEYNRILRYIITAIHDGIDPDVQLLGSAQADPPPVGDETVTYTDIKMEIFGSRLKIQMEAELAGVRVTEPTLFANSLDFNFARRLLTEFPIEEEVRALPNDIVEVAMRLIFASDDVEENKRVWDDNEPEHAMAVLYDFHAEYISRQPDADQSVARAEFREQQEAHAASEHERSVQAAHEEGVRASLSALSPLDADKPCTEEAEDLDGNAFIGEDGNDLIPYVELEDGSCLSLEDILKTIHGQRWGHKEYRTHLDLYLEYRSVLASIGEEWDEGDPPPEEIELREMTNPIGASAFTDVDMNNILELVRSQ